jgi:hypothetical protein
MSASNQSSRKEFLNNETIFHYLQSMYEELLEQENVITDDILTMNTCVAEQFWNRFEVYAFDALGYINLIPTLGVKSVINKRINNDYLNQINICDSHYEYYEHYIEVVSFYFCHDEIKKNEFKQSLTQPKIGLLK